MVKEASVKREKYENWIKKCKQNIFGTPENLYRIDAKGFLHFKNRIYVPNQLNVKHMVFKELHDNPYAGHPDYQNLLIAINEDF